MPDLYLVEPAPSSAWAPFQASRPVAELRAGAWLIRERWEAVAAGETRAVFGPPHLVSFVEDGAAPVRLQAPVAGPALVGRSDFAPAGVAPELPPGPARLINDEVVVGWWVPPGATWQGGGDFPGDALEIEGVLLHGAFDLITALEDLLAGDVADFQHERGDAIPDGSVVLGDPEAVVLLGAAIEPGVVFDVRHGGIVIEQHAQVRHGARLVGPVYVGPGTEVLGGSIQASAFGPRCKVRGEIAESVFLGYANKQHDGFLGHSVVGRWVNLGAATNTSDLKNTYGPVRLVIGAERIETGLQFLGTLIGDHAKTAIGTLLPTGAVVGVAANVFGSANAPKTTPPFAWGTGGERMTLDGFLTIARRVMPRRAVPVTDAVVTMLTDVYRHAGAP
jgi:UDP-N-acetylglucosamine diphosphorylase/glucosamine-1-phosphate N-acetyltransferase